MRLTYGSLDLTDYPYSIVWGSDFGAPQNQTEALAFLLQDGEVELSDRASNRTLQFSVLVEGVDLKDCAENEAALIAESEKPRNTIAVDPEDNAPVTVYETFRGQVAHARDDDGEMARLRVYTVTVNAAPFARSATETVTAALGATGTTTTLVDNGSATTNWTGAVDGVAATPNVSSGAVGVTASARTGDATISLTRTASITTSSTKYLVVDYRVSGGANVATHRFSDLTGYADGVALSRLASVYVGSNTFRATFLVAASSVAAFRMDLLTRSRYSTSPAASRVFYVDNINRTDIRPVIGTARQQLRTIAVGGSVRTPGTLTVTASTSLGDALLYVCRQDTDTSLYAPPVTPYIVGGSRSAANPAFVSGNYDTVAAAASVSYDVPMSTLPRGKYLLVGRMTGTGTGSLTYSTQTRINSTAVDSAVTGSTTGLAMSASMTVYPFGPLNLPQTAVLDPTTATVRLTITNTGASTMTIDELWLFNLSIGQLVQVACGNGTAASGGPSKSLFVSPPSIDRPYPLILRGHAADGSDAFHQGVQAWQFPIFTPPAVLVHLVTTDATDADAAFANFNHWHTNAAD